jgi:hypothetical protein
MIEFCRARPRATFLDLAAALGPDTPPILLLSLLREDARASNWDYFVKTVFVRQVAEHFPQGWMKGPNPDFQRARVYGSWCSSIGPGYEQQQAAIRTRFKEPDNIPDGWLPEDEQDPVFARLFAGLHFTPPKTEFSARQLAGAREITMKPTIDYEAILGPLGGCLRRDRTDKWWELDCGDFVLSIELGRRSAASGVSLGIGCGVSHKGLSAIARQILGEPARGPHSFKYDQRRTEVESLDGADVHYRRLIEEEVEEVRNIDMEKVIKDFAANCPDRPSMPQVMHLASLAWLADFTTLLDYQDIFKRGYRMNFVPMITPEMIQRAVQIAFDRA